MKQLLIDYLTLQGQQFNRAKNDYQGNLDDDYQSRVNNLLLMKSKIDEMSKALTFAISAEDQAKKMRTVLKPA